jgi:hypothetical protein
MSSDVDTELSSLSPSERSRIYDVFSDLRRRYVVAYVSDAGRPVSREELSDALASRNASERADAVTELTRDDAAISLHHIHLPKLTAAGIVEESAEGVSLTEFGERSLSSIRDDFGTAFRDGTTGDVR